MPEEGKEMLGPEQESKVEGQGPERKPEFKPWIFKDLKEVEEIKNPQLKRIIVALEKTPQALRNRQRLENFYSKIEDPYIEGKISEEEAGYFLGKISQRLEKLSEEEKKRESGKLLDRAAQKLSKAAEIQAKSAKGEFALELPPRKNKEAQRAFVRKILNTIENSNRDCHDLAISTVVKNLEASLDQMDEEVREEVEARLSLHDCSELIRQANGWISRDPQKVGPGHTIGSAAAEALRRSHDLTRKKIKTLFGEIVRYGSGENKREEVKGILPGLKIAEAWDLLQKAVFNYKYFLTRLGLKGGLEALDDEKRKGKVPSNFFTDSDSTRKTAVREYLIKELGGGESGRKSLQLAEKLAIATLETSVFNKSATGNDELAEIINFRSWRKGRARTGRARGPKIHEEAIPGFGKSWLRFVGDKGTDEILEAKDILEKIGEIREGSYSYFCSVIVTRYYLLKELLLDRAPKPRTIDENFLQKAVVYFDTADKPKENERCGPLALRVWWLAGVVDIALAKENLEWDAYSFRELKKAATMEELSPKARTFITQEQWNWIEKVTNFQRRLDSLFRYRVTRESLKSLKLP